MKIAVLLPNWIGDVVMATPTLRAIRQKFPDALVV
jgi:heptosyltransferase-2